MKLNKFITTAAVAVLGSALSAQAATFTAGDLLLAFRSTAETNTFVINLGTAANYRNDFVGTFTSLFGAGGLDISAGLNSAFTNGFNLSTTFMGIASVRESGSTPGAPVNGDVRRTLYLGAESLPADPSNAWTGYTSSGVGAAATAITGFQNGFAASTANFNSGRGSVIPTSANNTWDEFNTGTVSFSVFGTQNNNGVEADLGGSITSLDVYRLTVLAGGVSSNGTGTSTEGTGTYEGTFTLSSSGTLNAVPEPSTYALMALSGLALYGAVRRNRKNA